MMTIDMAKRVLVMVEEKLAEFPEEEKKPDSSSKQASIESKKYQ